MSRLTAPLRIGDRTAPARLLFGPHVTNLGRRRGLSPRHVAYYARRARGGAGLVVTEIASVHASDWPYERAPLAEQCVPGWAAVSAAVKDAGALAIAGLGHSGGQGTSAYSQAELWAPSPVPQNNDREVPKQMEPADVRAVISAFAASADQAHAAGMDGVEVNAGQFSLLRQFLSGLTNHRGDAYGEERSRLLREVLGACRGGRGRGILGLRICGDELAPWAGITPESAAHLVDEVADEVDYLVVEIGSIYSVSATRPDGHVDPGFNLDLIRAMREVTRGRTVLVAQGSIVDVDMAETALEEGICDAVEMTRAQIADADLGNKVRAGDVGRVRPCLLCNQRCMVRDARNPVVSCAVDPSAGWEGIEPTVEGSALRPASMLVVGGGPAGLEAARAAAARGHKVSLREQASELGGALRTAAGLPGLERMRRYLDWLEAEVRSEGVTIETSTSVEAPDVAAHPGPVLLCTGSSAGVSELPDSPLPVFDGRSALEALAGTGDAALPSGPVVIWDPLGGALGLGLAERLADGRQVTLITPDLVAGRDLAQSGDLAPGNTRLQQAGVHIVKTAEVVAIDDEVVIAEDRYTGVRRPVEASFIVDARHREPELALWVATGKRYPRVGDALAPRNLHEALLEARRAVLAEEREV